MQKVLLFISILCGFHLFCLAQSPDYVIYNGVTTFSYIYPLEQYFDKIGNRSLGTFHTNQTFHNSRGYRAMWEIRNDSLYLVKISNVSDDSVVADLPSVFGSTVVFANWFNGKLLTSDGQLLFKKEGYYDIVYQFDKMLYFENGRIVKTKTTSNQEKANRLITFEKMNRLAKDTVFSALKKLNWGKLDNEDCLYDQDYWLYYNKYGKIKMVGMPGGIWGKKEDRKKNWRNRKERRLIKNTVKNVNLYYLRPLTSFKVFISISYNEDTRTLELEKR